MPTYRSCASIFASGYRHIGLVAVLATTCSAAGAHAVGLAGIPDLREDDLRVVVMGDSFSVSSWNRTFPLVLQRLPEGQVSAVQSQPGGWRFPTDGIVMGDPEHIRAEDSAGYWIERDVSPQRFFTLPVGEIVENILPASEPDSYCGRVRLRRQWLSAGEQYIPGDGHHLGVRLITREPSSDATHAADIALGGTDSMSSLLDLFQLPAPPGPGRIQALTQGVVTDVIPGNGDVDSILRNASGEIGRLQLAGSCWWSIDQDGIRRPGLYYSCLADSSWQYAGFCANQPGGSAFHKVFARSDLVDWLQATTIDANQDVVFVIHFATETGGVSELATVFEQIVDQCELAATESGITGTISCLFVLPTRNSIYGQPVDLEPVYFEQHWEAMVMTATNCNNVAAVSLYHLTDGMRFDGNDDAREWLRNNNYTAFNHAGSTYDLADGPLAGDLLDGSNLHPVDDVSAGFFASIFLDTLEGGACPEDIDGNGMIGINDILIALGNFNGTGQGDVDGNGVVDINDILLIVGAWNTSC